MAERPPRRQQPFRLWIPSWRRISRASLRPSALRKPQPPLSSLPPPDSESPPQNSHILQTSPARSGRGLSLPPQADGENATSQSESTTQESANALPAGQQTIEKNGGASRITEYTSVVEYPTDELTNDSLGKTLEAQFTEASQPHEDEQQQAFQPILVETLQEVKREFGIKQVTSSELEPQKDQQLEPASRTQSLESEAKLENMTADKQELHLLEAEKASRELKSEDGGATRVVALEEETHRTVTEEPKDENKTKLSITVSESKPKTREFIYEDRKSEPDNVEEQENGTLKESKRKIYAKESKITISSMPRPSSPNVGPPNMHKELKDGLSRLVQKLSIGHQNKLGNEQGVNIITLAGENKGASMFIGYEGFSGEGKIRIHRGEKQEKDICHAHPVAAGINSNVQGINNSVLDETTYRAKNPGVQMTISTKPTTHVNFKGAVESPKEQKAASRTTTAQKLTYEPNIKRRCLRSLFLESSDEDIEDPLKPRRHGCRFSCDDKKKEKVEAGTNVKQ